MFFGMIIKKSLKVFKNSSLKKDGKSISLGVIKCFSSRFLLKTKLGCESYLSIHMILPMADPNWLLPIGWLGTESHPMGDQCSRTPSKNYFRIVNGTRTILAALALSELERHHQPTLFLCPFSSG